LYLLRGIKFNAKTTLSLTISGRELEENLVWKGTCGAEFLYIPAKKIRKGKKGHGH